MMVGYAIVRSYQKVHTKEVAAIKKGRKELRKLEQKVSELEEQVEQLKRRTGDSRVREIVTWTVALIELTTAILALIAILTG